MNLLFEKNSKGSNSFRFPLQELPEIDLQATLPENHWRTTDLGIPELPEVEAVRHFTELSTRAFGVDSGMYPLGSCTMKYNPKINELLANLPGFTNVHPYQPEETVQGALELLYELQLMLADIGGMDQFTLQPAAGAHGEMTGIMILRTWHKSQGNDEQRNVILVPDSAHGTNPATASVVGYKVREVKSNEFGRVSLDDLKAKLDDHVAGLMLTNPNTLGLFETDIEEIAKLVHEAGGLLYYDGANLNAIMGMSRPGDMGFDIVHFNLHKTFATPHGGGGPGAGAVGVKEFLTPFLPVPHIIKRKDGSYGFDYNRPQSIGKVKTFYGNFGVCVKAYAWIKSVGPHGLRDACQHAVLNANYLRHELADDYEIPFNVLCKHEFVATSARQKEAGIHTLDIAKRLMDFGYHPPTIYFPLIVPEAMMFEPTETESKERLDQFIAAMKQIAEECRTTPELVHGAPHTTVIGRVDDTRAARHPVLQYKPEVEVES
ncbi:MAG: aminomethyl-transferring glycine dehydrogenase subunit GcvPB [Planctomycetia bacterium]|nr:aminomethyl-transferring glycine dehydrogenase subunit GcvPB [Planctomycetia bacterium]